MRPQYEMFSIAGAYHRGFLLFIRRGGFGDRG